MKFAKSTPPGYKPSPLQRAKMADRVKKGIIDPTGANVGRQAVPMRMKKGGSVGSASKRADGCATKGKTKGRFV
jgi:hypothetical protein